MLALSRDVSYTNTASLIATNIPDAYVHLLSSACATRQPRLCVAVTERRTLVSVRSGQRTVQNDRRLCCSLVESVVSTSKQVYLFNA